MKTVLVDSRIGKEVRHALELLGFSPIELPRSVRLGEAVCSHPDTLIFKYRKQIIVSADYCDEAAYVFTELRERHADISIHFAEDTLGAKYPEDTKFNALICAGELFCKKDSISKSILELAEREGLRVNHVRQGYPACSALAIGNSAITSDIGLARAMRARGIDVTLIRVGHISLPPHEYGFIGGASSVFGGKVFFFGDYKLHPDADKIESAILRAGFVPVSLSASPLVDLGGAVFFEQQTDNDCHHRYDY